jgi:tripeptidyl-peptidase-2
MKIFTFLIFFLFISLEAPLAQTRPAGSTTQSTPAKSVEEQTKESSSWSFLSLGVCGVDAFQKQNPTYDGRGTIVCILDDGVDIGITGLLKTSEGKTKVIDVQDMSGTGDVAYTEAKREGDKIIVGGKEVLRGLSSSINSYNGKYYYGVLPEIRFQNGLDDLNFNGSDSDFFGVLIYQDRAEHFVAVVDGEGDRDVSNEQVLTNFRESQTTFKFRATSDAKKSDGRYLTGAVNIYPKDNRINLYFADGGHGTHVAGIATGCGIGGQQGFNGVAPGAELVALKFSDNTMGGVTTSGSMKRSYEYVVKLARETGKPVIANMSFGIGSEIEGQSVMDLWLDSVLDANPDVTVCISGSNDGPGLSNIGLPGSSRNVITSAAILPDDTGRDLYGVNMSKSVVWDFSSRGGELAKPDIATPGTAISTVPDYVGNDRYNGTSMASPYTTGFCSALISSMIQKYPGYKPNCNLVKRALQLSAKPIEGMTFLDQGAGVPDLSIAFKLLSGWHLNNDAPKQYKIEVPVGNSVGKGTAAYYRNGYFPKNGERTVFTVTPITSKTVGREQMISFNAYDLKVDAPWLSTVQSTVYRRGTGAFTVNVSYDQSKLHLPGIYTGKVLGYPKGKKNAYPEFELWNTVIIPHRFSHENNYRVTTSPISIRKEHIRREFFTVPPACIGLKVQLKAKSDGSVADGIIINNDGRTFDRVSLKKNTADGTATTIISRDENLEGVVEIVVKSGLSDDDASVSDVELSVEAIVMEVSKQWQASNTDGSISIALHMVNGSKEITFTPDFAIKGFERVIDTVLEKTDEFVYPFRRLSNETSAYFSVLLEREGYNQYTDIGLQILKASNASVSNGGFDERESATRVLFTENDTNSYRLFFKGGLADPDKTNTTHLSIGEVRGVKQTVAAAIVPTGKITLAPEESIDLRLRFKDTRSPALNGLTGVGELSLKIVGLSDEITIPIRF